jgi:hypothetical protein
LFYPQKAISLNFSKNNLESKGWEVIRFNYSSIVPGEEELAIFGTEYESEGLGPCHPGCPVYFKASTLIVRESSPFSSPFLEYLPVLFLKPKQNDMGNPKWVGVDSALTRKSSISGPI